MTADEHPAHRRATPRQRRRLEQAPVPVTDPLAQDYAAWRGVMLRRAVLATVLSFGLTLAHGSIELHADDDTPAPSVEAPPWRLLIVLALVLLVYLGTALTSFVLTVIAAWQWHRVRRSRRLARSAWLIWFFGPLPVFLVPLHQILGLHGKDALVTAEEQVRGVLTFYLPVLFALLPAVIRTALMLKRFLPESQLTGGLAVLAAPFCAVVYLLILSVLIQITVNPYLIGGLLLLTAAPLVYPIRARALMRRDTAAGAGRTVRTVQGTQTVLTLAGLALLMQYAATFPDLYWLLGQINIVWFLAFVAGVVASRSLLTVVLTDFLLGLLHHGQESTRQLAGTSTAATLDRKISTLGEVLRGARTIP